MDLWMPTLVNIRRTALYTMTSAALATIEQNWVFQGPGMRVKNQKISRWDGRSRESLGDNMEYIVIM
jgi:hypothetical protein